ncbi:MAG: hypothetical protein ACFFCS_11580 [Candidatus Hodarchaeota archaeon]
MGFKTLLVKDFEDETFEWSPIVNEGDIAFIIDDVNRTLYVWHGIKSSMVKRYKAGMLAPKVKSQCQLYSYTTVVVAQGEEPEDLREEIDKLLKGEGELPSEEEQLSLIPSDGEPTVVSELRGPTVLDKLDVTVEKLETEPPESSARVEELEEENEKLSAELEGLKKELVAIKVQMDEKIQVLQEEKENLIAESGESKKGADELKSDLEGKIKLLESENEKINSEKDDLKDTLEKKITSLEEEKNKLEKENITLGAEKNSSESIIKELKSDKEGLKKELAEKTKEMESRIQGIKENLAYKIKTNFFNIKQLPSAPVGSIWFESIVQVKVGDEAIFENGADLEKLKEVSEQITVKVEKDEIEIEAPKVELKKPEAPKVELKKPEAPKVEHKKPDEPKVKHKKPDEPKVKHKKPDEPKVELKKPDEPKVELKEPDESVIKEVILDEAPRPEEISLDFASLDDNDDNDKELAFSLPDMESEED